MEWFKSFSWLFIELAFLFIGISFLVNLLQGFIPFEKIERKLVGSNKWVGGLFALIFAFVTPFCSCSTIPIIVNMLKRKFPFGVVMVFLFASPLLDPTIISVMGFMLGWKVALIYTILTSIFSYAIGFLLEKWGLETQVKNVTISGYEEKEHAFSLKEAWAETFQLMKTVLPYLLLGAVIGATIKNLVPMEWMANTFGTDGWWLVPIAAILGIPLYIRLASMIPISTILIGKGMALGPVMALLISSAGASLPEVMLLHSIFKKKLVYLFILSVVSMATMSGFLFYLI
ncbi:permease [Bacillus carboniphilus]|uniref:Permease n=1 Tax=Bacillus carboniphilus TaxID=86663 RepID=A0ABP3FEE2_9BACI